MRGPTDGRFVREVVALFGRCLAYFNVIAIPPRSALTINPI